MAKQKKLELKILFDTSVLYTENACNLIHLNIETLIKDYSNLHDLRISWYLPSIVCIEREFQMLKEGKKLLPPIQKLEKLLGHNLNITEKIVHDSIKSTIKQHLTDNSLNILEPNIDTIDWNNIIQKSLWRIPPFEEGKKEKGFRDEIIQQIFLQLVIDSPKTPSICRIIFLTNDELLLSSLREATKNSDNVKIFSDLEDLKGLINTLASQVKEEMIEVLSKDVSGMFFEKENQECLYYKRDVGSLIQEKYKSQLRELAPGSQRRSNGTWFISKPRFSSKKGQRITWKSRINVASKAYKTVKDDNQTNSFSTALASAGSAYTLPTTIYSPPMNVFTSNDLTTSPFLGEAKIAGYSNIFDIKEVLVAEGRTTFEVTWSVTVTTNKKFRTPHIDSTDFIEINWNDKIGDK